MLLVEQNFRFAATWPIATNREHGEVIDMIENDRLEENLDKLQTYLGV